QRAMHPLPRIARRVTGVLPREVIGPAMAVPLAAELRLDVIERARAPAVAAALPQVTFPSVLVSWRIAFVRLVLAGVGSLAIIAAPVFVFGFRVDALGDEVA